MKKKNRIYEFTVYLNIDYEIIRMKSDGLPGNLICLTKKEGIHREYAFLGRYVYVMFLNKNPNFGF